MKRFAEIVVKSKWIIFIIFLLLIGLSIYFIPKRQLSFDIYDLLPDEVESVKGLKILEEEISHGADLTIIYETDNLTKVEKLIDKLKILPYIDSVMWLDDFQDISLPKEFWGEESKDWYKDGVFKIQVTLKHSQSYGDQIEDIKSILPKEASITGNDVLMNELKDRFKGKTEEYFIIGIILVSIFLFLTFPRFWGPIFIVLSMVSAVVINMGITAFSGKPIFYLSETIVAILQLAVTLDYSLFLYHRYVEERIKNSKETAMVDTLTTTIKPILLSGLTTIAGFFALTFGKLDLFPQMGWLLVRGVTISLIASFLFLPSLFLIFDKLVIGGKKHGVIPLTAGNLGKFIGKLSPVFIIIFIIVLSLSYFGSTKIGLEYDQKHFLPEDLPSIRTMNKVNDIFGERDTLFIISKKENEGFIDALYKVKNLKGVKNVLHYSTMVDPTIPEEFIPEDLISRFSSKNYTYAIVYSKYPPEDEREKALRKEITNIVHNTVKGEVYGTGESALINDVKEISMKDLERTGKISIYLILIIIALGFLSLFVPPVLALIIKVAIWSNIAYYTMIGMSPPFFIPILLNTIQLGATIDYAVLLTSRYQEERRNGLKPLAAITEAVHWSSHSILTSAGTMILMTLPTAMLSDIKVLSLSMGSLARGAMLSTFAVLIFLPALLAGLDKLFKYTTFRWSKKEV
ncbi:MAG: hypothetical protein DRI28_03745 [Caldiserica bacterium]|nr:MAG: hypothetical protein DRI28_03745 [Caldisericota bacterium]